MAGQDFSRIVASVAADIEDGADVAALGSISDVEWHKAVATKSALGGGGLMIVASVIVSLSPTIDLFAVAN